MTRVAENHPSLTPAQSEALHVLFHEALVVDALRLLRIAAPTFAVLLLVEAVSHLTTYDRSGPMVWVPALLATCTLVLGWAAWMKPGLLRRPEWMVLVPWSAVTISVLQHLAHGVGVGTVLILVATLIAIGPLILATGPSMIAIGCTAALLAYGCSVLFDQIFWIYPALMTPVALIMRASRRNAIWEAERRRWLERDLAAKAAEVEHLRRLRGVSSGVAHHFNNLLAALLGHISVAQEEAKAGGDVVDDLEAAQRTGARAAALIRDLLAATRSEVAPTLEPIDPEGLLESLREGEQPTGVELEWHVDHSLPPIWGERQHLPRALQHLVENAAESGATRVSIHAGPADPGRGAVPIVVVDDGPGIPAEDLGRACDPFFTTRGPARAGLGLAFARGTIERCGGSLHLENRAAGGLRARVALSIANADGHAG